MFPKKGQAAVEYLVTYGWAFLAILATVGVLSYFGLFNPERYIPDRCEFGKQLSCQDQYLDDAPTVTLRFRNNFEDTIRLVDAYGDDINGIVGGSVSIGVGEIRRVDIDTSRTLFSGSKENFDIVFEFQRDDGSPSPSTPRHNISGEIFGEVQDSTIGILG